MSTVYNSALFLEPTMAERVGSEVELQLTDRDDELPVVVGHRIAFGAGASHFLECRRHVESHRDPLRTDEAEIRVAGCTVT